MSTLRWLLIGLGAAVVLAIFILWPQVRSYIPLSIIHPTATSTLQGEVASTDLIAWKPIASASPIKQVSVSQQYPEDGYTYFYAFYDVGTFMSGQFLGDKIELGISSYKSPTGEVATYDNTFVYVVTNANGALVGWWQDRDSTYPSELGLSNIPRLSESAFPSQLLTYHPGDQTLVRPTLDGPITVQPSMVLVTYNLQLQPVLGFQFDGDPILRSPATAQTGVFSTIQPYDYYVQLPTGALFSASLMPGFMSAESSVPNLTWSVGSTTVAAYNYDQYAYGLADCYDSFATFDELKATFIQTGTTAQGDPVYEVNPVGHEAVFQCLYAKTQRYDYDATTGNSTSYYPATFGDFLTSHPVFFWKNATGDWVIFGRTDVVPAAEKAKPVIYLYPTKTENINVQVNPIGGFTNTDPAYGSGWNVSATPDSILTNLSDGKTYPYLFWEGGKDGVVATPKQGFVVKQSDIPALLEQKLTLLGLNQKERADFAAFWVPRLSKAPYYFITFIPRSEIDRVAPLTIVPQPDTVIRILMDYAPLAQPVAVDPLVISPTTRQGFTAVEWGGIVR